MERPRLQAVCRGYLLLLMLAATVLSPAPRSVAALALLLATVYLAVRPHRPGVGLSVAVAALLVLPATLEPVAALALEPGRLSAGAQGTAATAAAAVAATIPALWQLHSGLKATARSAALPLPPHGERRPTRMALTLAASVLATVLVAVVGGSLVLLLSGGALLFYLLAAMTMALLRLRLPALVMPQVRVRTLAGESARATLAPASRMGTDAPCVLSAADGWVRLGVTRLSLDGTAAAVSLTVQPPLAGPSQPSILAGVSDARGLVALGHTLRPLHVHVIPRARYARWMAERYLEGTGADRATDVSATDAPAARGRGIEYVGSRSYQPGDELKRVDWKHTLKLDQFIIKEFAEAGGQTAVLAVNLAAADAEEADRLSHAILSAALGLARAAVPSALVAYDHRQAVVATGVTGPREALRRAMRLTARVSTDSTVSHVLQQADPMKLRRSLAQLAGASSGSARRLRDLLEFEQAALQAAAERHPAAQALLQSVSALSPPATVVLVSLMNHDRDAISVLQERLARRGFTLMRPALAARARGRSPEPRASRANGVAGIRPGAEAQP